MTAGTATPRREGAGANVLTWIGRLPRSPIFYGIAVAVIAGVAGQWLSISPPAAYGICSACHGRDLVDWTLNHVEGTKLYVTTAGANWPLLTVIGLVLGSFAASKRNGEYASVDLGGNLRQFGLGFVVMCACLFVGGCPTRMIIRTGYGDVAAALTLAGIAGGVVIATLTMRWMARR
jgi:hypothetical protein